MYFLCVLLGHTENTREVSTLCPKRHLGRYLLCVPKCPKIHLVVYLSVASEYGPSNLSVFDYLSAATSVPIGICMSTSVNRILVCVIIK